MDGALNAGLLAAQAALTSRSPALIGSASVWPTNSANYEFIVFKKVNAGNTLFESGTLSADK